MCCNFEGLKVLNIDLLGIKLPHQNELCLPGLKTPDLSDRYVTVHCGK